MTLPTFLGIGVQRAATTWLHDCLREHPDVYLPDVKELHFFNHHFEKGVEWYQSHFAETNGETAIGEITPLYLHTAPLERLHELCPDARLLIILRDPFDRAYSGFKLMQNQFFTGMTFEQALETPRGKCLLLYSLYSKKLRALFELYPREQVLIELYGDVRADPRGLYARVCQHLGVDSGFEPSKLKEISNRIIFPNVQNKLQNIGLSGPVELIKKTPIGSMIKGLSKRRQHRTAKSSGMKTLRGQLVDTFREDVNDCELLLGRDLSHWLKA